MKTIDGVPESLTPAQIIAAVESLGFDVKVVRSITFGPDYVEVVVFATKPIRIKANTDETATHTIYYDTLAEPPVDD